MKKLYIPILLGTARIGRKSEAVAKYVLKEAKKIKPEVNFELIDIRNFLSNRTYGDWQKNAAGKKWSVIMKKANGLIIVAPEYNHSFPGELKIVLDYLFEEYADKPVGVCGVSNGLYGGSRMIENLIPVLVNFRMIPVADRVYFRNCNELFDKNGEINDKTYKKSIEKMLLSLVRKMSV